MGETALQINEIFHIDWNCMLTDSIYNNGCQARCILLIMIHIINCAE